MKVAKVLEREPNAEYFEEFVRKTAEGQPDLSTFTEAQVREALAMILAEAKNVVAMQPPIGDKIPMRVNWSTIMVTEHFINGKWAVVDLRDVGCDHRSMAEAIECNETVAELAARLEAKAKTLGIKARATACLVRTTMEQVA